MLCVSRQSANEASVSDRAIAFRVMLLKAFLRANPCLLPREGRLGGERCKHFLTINLRHITPKHLEKLGGRIERGFCVSKAPSNRLPISLRRAEHYCHSWHRYSASVLLLSGRKISCQICYRRPCLCIIPHFTHSSLMHL